MAADAVEAALFRERGFFIGSGRWPLPRFGGAIQRELNYQATHAAAALALKDAPAQQDPYRQPANATDRPSLSSADWMRDNADGQLHRQVKTAVAGANDRGLYEQETASPQRAAQLAAAPDGNCVLELETTRALMQPALAEQAQAIAAIGQSPPSAQDLQRKET